MPSAKRIFEVLLIEDNQADAELLKECFRECAVPTRIHHLAQSKDAIRYLFHADPYRDGRTPDLILLDWHHPLDGGMALAELRGSVYFRHIPVVVITGDQSPMVVRDIWSYGANAVFYKPIELDHILRLVCEVAQMFLTRAMLPPRTEPPAVG